ncbi:MAG TPA: FtsQ-type POTRA domain-containing protein [Ktedonobacteraceae bacterium]
MGEHIDMTYKQPDGIDPRRHRNRTSAPVSRSYTRRGAGEQPAARERKAALAQVRNPRGAVPGKVAATERPRVLDASERLPERNERIVTMPHEAVQPLTWAERHARYRGQPSDQSASEQLAPRTLAQTARPARASQAGPRKQLPRRRGNSRVPSRSGKLRGQRSIWHRFLGLFLLLAVVAGGIGFALFSPTFKVQQIDISGTQNQRLMSTIRHMNIAGQNIFLLDQTVLVNRLEALPPIESASLGVRLPGTILVAVQERVPVLLWQAGSQTYGLGQDGVVIAPQRELSGTEHLSLVVDTRRGAAQIRPGSHFDAADIVLIEQVFEQVPGIEGVAPFSLQYVDSITEGAHQVPANLAGRGSYVIISANGWRAYLGDAQNSTSLANRLQELQQILSIGRQKGLQIATIDLRFGLRPTYTLKS